MQVTIEGAIVSSADITPTTNGDGWELYMDTGNAALSIFFVYSYQWFSFFGLF